MEMKIGRKKKELDRLNLLRFFLKFYSYLSHAITKFSFNHKIIVEECYFVNRNGSEKVSIMF